MHLQEYQAKAFLSGYGILVPPFAMAANLFEVEQALEKLHLQSAVLKVQIHAGGRGKAGGVKLARSRQEILTRAAELLGKRMITPQTGREGVVARLLLISPPDASDKEFYVGAAIDRKKACATLILSSEGGIEIEEVARAHPEKILKETIGPEGKLRGYQLRRMAKFMGWNGATAEQGKKLLRA